MSKSKNVGFHLYNRDGEDTKTRFQDFRDSLAGTQLDSNFQKTDAMFQNHAEQIGIVGERLNGHVGNQGNPHNVTASQVTGLSEVATTGLAQNISVKNIGGIAGDNAQIVLSEINDKTFGVYVHSKTGTIHTLTGVGANIKFKANASFAHGDTWLVNGASVTAKTVDGQGLHTGDIVAGSVVLATVDGGVLWFQIRSYDSQLADFNSQLSKFMTRFTHPLVVLLDFLMILLMRSYI